jgi:MoxR-like ATPase
MQLLTSQPARRPPNNSESKWFEAAAYKPDPEIVSLMEMAVRLRQPLLLTGAPGCGKTLAAYYAARVLWKLEREDLIHHQIRSSDTTERVRYEFDDVRYFRESQRSKDEPYDWKANARTYINPGPLWLAFEAMASRRMVLLFDEIDKAPRDFPNDLLHEFDTRGFWVPELSAPIAAPADSENLLWIVTSNGERDLPDAFLRRCVQHHIELTPEQVDGIVRSRLAAGEIRLDPKVAKRAVERFRELGSLEDLRHRPGLAELIVWLKALAILSERKGDEVQKRLDIPGLSSLPVVGALLKDPQDRKLLG